MISLVRSSPVTTLTTLFTVLNIIIFFRILNLYSGGKLKRTLQKALIRQENSRDGYHSYHPQSCYRHVGRIYCLLLTNICRQVRGACQGFSKVKIKIKSRSSHAIVISGYRSFLVESIQTSFDQIYQYYYFDAVRHNVTS